MATRAARNYSTHIEHHHAKESIMNIIKHMEAAFVVALVTAGAAGYVQAAREAQAQSASIATPTKMAVVTVSAKRLTPAQKLQMVQAERRAGVQA
jgi:1-aminocyclopropane-1-carboxylate deaminase/D-cysteine desulfhydrase-like pyridoxal-dependent ACC family enzyme